MNEAVLRENLREAWAALAMIREAVETLGPVGAVKGTEALDGPTFMHEADALVEGIRKLANPGEWRCAICGFIIDTRFAAEKPTANFETRGRRGPK